MKINLSKGSSIQNNFFEQKNNVKNSSSMALFNNLVSPKNYQKREINYHTKFNKDYETTLNFIEGSNIKNKKKPETSPVYKKIKSVLNEFFEVPLESKFNNPKFKIGCICPEVFDLPKQDIKTKMNATKFEILKKTSSSQSPQKYFNRSVNSTQHNFKDFIMTQQSFNPKDDDDIKEKIKLKSERSSKFASTNGTSVKSESNNPYFSPKNSSFSSITFLSPSTTSNKFFTSTDRKLFALVNNGQVNESFGLTKKKDSNPNLNNLKINMSKIPKSMASQLEKKFPELVIKNRINTSNFSSINFEEYQNRVKIRNMRYKVEKLFNQ